MMLENDAGLGTLLGRPHGNFKAIITVRLGLMDHFVVRYYNKVHIYLPFRFPDFFQESANFLMIMMIDCTFHKATLQARQSG